MAVNNWFLIDTPLAKAETHSLEFQIPNLFTGIYRVRRLRIVTHRQTPHGYKKRSAGHLEKQTVLTSNLLLAPISAPLHCTHSTSTFKDDQPNPRRIGILPGPR